MGNCATCDDPTVYESNTEQKPLKKVDDNVFVTPQQKKTNKHVRTDLTLCQLPDFSNPFILEALQKMGPFSYRCDDKENILPHWGPAEIEPNVFYEG